MCVCFTDIVLDLLNYSVHLSFSPTTQQLALIEIDTSEAGRVGGTSLSLRYQHSTFSSAALPPTFNLVYQLFGPTHPGEYLAGSSVYLLHYPGLSFLFPIPAKYADRYNHGKDIPLELPDNTTPVATKIYLYAGRSIGSSRNDRVIASWSAAPVLSDIPPRVNPTSPAGLDALAVSPGPSPMGANVFFEELRVMTESSTADRVPVVTFTRSGRSVCFGDSPQDLLATLGAPSGVFAKDVDKMRIHALAAYHRSANQSPPPSSAAPGLLSSPTIAAAAHNTASDAKKGSKSSKKRNNGKKRRGGDNGDGDDDHDGVDMGRKSLVDGNGSSKATDSSASSPGQAHAVATTRRGRGENGISGADYFYNYFELGMDLLMDATTHVLKKVVFHTNVPGHFEFNNYAKANFRIHIPLTKAGREASLAGLKNGRGGRSGTGGAGGIVDGVLIVGPDSKWPMVEETLGSIGQPVVYNRGTNTNPFGATYFYGFRNLIFEVMKNGHIATVIVFSEDF